MSFVPSRVPLSRYLETKYRTVQDANKTPRMSCGTGSSLWPQAADALVAQAKVVHLSEQERVYVQVGGHVRELMPMALRHRRRPTGWKTPRDGLRVVMVGVVVLTVILSGTVRMVEGGSGSAPLTSCALASPPGHPVGDILPFNSGYFTAEVLF